MILWVYTDTPTDILPRKCKLRSKFWWLTGFCNSHDVSHFAAFFIVVVAKTSIAESVWFRFLLVVWRFSPFHTTHILSSVSSTFWSPTRFSRQGLKRPSSQRCLQHRSSQMIVIVFPLNEKPLIAFLSQKTTSDFQLGVGCGNDPSAGSPTETLLRLHLPLNDEV